jgi:hypothetical protein
MAEEFALSRCNLDPDRKDKNGPCFLYAVGDRVVLPSRLTEPRLIPKTVAEALSYLGVQDATTHRYLEASPHRAVAFAPENDRTFRPDSASSELSAQERALEYGRTFRWDSASSELDAQERALDGCQLMYGAACILVASDDELLAPDVWRAPRRDMPRVHYHGHFEPQNVPMFFGIKASSYVVEAEPKALAIRPSGGRFEIGHGATEVEAQVNALAACNAYSSAFPCVLYAVSDRVVIDEQLTKPME